VFLKPRQRQDQRQGIGNAACFKVAHVSWAVQKVPRLVHIGWAVYHVPQFVIHGPSQEFQFQVRRQSFLH
jgi:hypothetical protein